MIITRRAVPEDAWAIATIHVRAWQKAYRGIVPDDYLDTLSIDQRATGWRQILTHKDSGDVWVALKDDLVLGWISSGPSRDSGSGPATGEIWAIYVSPEHWRTGIGRLLYAEAEQRLAELGMKEVTLWVLKGNTHARRFYESLGFSIDPGAEKTMTKTGAELSELRMRKQLS